MVGIINRSIMVGRRAGLGFTFSEELSLVAMSGHKDELSGRGAGVGDALD